jgi:protein involved in polysaccharide export with SLBB domain
MTPNGRVSLELDPKRQRLPELALEDGDRINIPRPPGHVAAVGAVYNDSVLIYKPGRTVADYLRVAGVTDTAERESTFVVRADGSILAPQPSGFLSLSRFNGQPIASIELMPGDTIVVPEQVTKESGYSVFMRGLKDWTQVLYQLGLAAAAVNTLNVK